MSYESFLISSDRLGSHEATVARLMQVFRALVADKVCNPGSTFLSTWYNEENRTTLPPGDPDLIVSYRDQPVTAALIERRARSALGFGYLLDMSTRDVGFQMAGEWYWLFQFDLAVFSEPLTPSDCYIESGVKAGQQISSIATLCAHKGPRPPSWKPFPFDLLAYFFPKKDDLPLKPEAPFQNTLTAFSLSHVDEMIWRPA